MIILEGPNTALRETLRHEIEKQLRPELGKLLTVHLSGTPGFGTTASVVRLLNSPNHSELRDGLPLRFPDHHPIHHMAGYALNATGTLLVHAINKAGEHPPASELSDHLWHVEVWNGDCDIAVGYVLHVWKERQKDIARTYRYGGSGHLEEGGVMVVGERVNPFRSRLNDAHLEDWAPLAFTSNQGCSFFLHGALRASGGRFYLTNAVKTLNKKLNRTLLAEELDLMQPRKIIAMGSEAAAALSEQRVDFVHTNHPQYWKRFRNNDVGELVELFRSASITTQKPV